MKKLEYGNLPPFLSPTVDMEVGKYFSSIDCPLIDSTMEIDTELAEQVASQPIPHTFPMWIRRCAIVFHIPPQTILTIMQAEQGALNIKKPPLTCFSVRRLNNNPNSPPPSIPPLWGGDWHKINAKGGWLAWQGDPKMVLLCGAGIIEGTGQERRQTEYYLGPARQIYWAARIAASCLNKWNEGKRVAQMDGEDIECDSPEAFFLLRYTPHAQALSHRPKIWRERFG